VKLISQDIFIDQEWLHELPKSAFESGRATAKDKYKLSVGDRPLARNLKTLYLKKEATLPPEIASLRGETYLITHAVGIVAKEAPNDIAVLGYSATLQDVGSTVELLPNTSFREYLSMSGKFEAAITADGHARIPSSVTKLLETTESLGGGGEIKLAGDTKVVGKVSISIKTPKIQAVGVASSTATWQLAKDDQPLVGDQLLVQMLVVPQGTKKVRFAIQAFAEIHAGVFLYRAETLKTKPLQVEVELGD
jgi:hypothetical protein